MNFPPSKTGISTAIYWRKKSADSPSFEFLFERPCLKNDLNTNYVSHGTDKSLCDRIIVFGETEESSGWVTHDREAVKILQNDFIFFRCIIYLSLGLGLSFFASVFRLCTFKFLFWNFVWTEVANNSQKLLSIFWFVVV